MKHVLFVCTHNAGRSQMAQAFFERHGPSDLRAESAGPRKLGIEEQLHADRAVTLACGADCPFVPTTVEDWDIPDPAGRSLEETRAIRDAIEVRVKDLIEQRIPLIRADRTAHQLRLAALLPRLADEFAGRRSDAEIRMCADAILSRFEDAPIRSHVLALAHRQTRECLRQAHCGALAVA